MKRKKLITDGIKLSLVIYAPYVVERHGETWDQVSRIFSNIKDKSAAQIEGKSHLSI